MELNNNSITAEKMPTLINSGNTDSIQTNNKSLIIDEEISLKSNNINQDQEMSPPTSPLTIDESVDEDIKTTTTTTTTSNNNNIQMSAGSSPKEPSSPNQNALSANETLNSNQNSPQSKEQQQQKSSNIQEDDSEIPAFAKILLNISANGIVIVPNLTESSPAILTGKQLKDSSNGLVPFDLASDSAMPNASSQNIQQSAGGDDSNDSYKKKRQRTSPEQLAILEQIFETDKMPSQQIRVRLANQLGMSSRRVQIWFQNKRAKVKRGGPFGSGKDGEDYLDEEDDEMDDSNLQIDDSNIISQLNTSSDNIVPSISPILSSVNLSVITPSNNSNISSPILPSFNLTPTSTTTTTTTSLLSLTSSTSSLNTSLKSQSTLPSPLKKVKRPSSPSSTPSLNTSTSSLNFSSINLQSSNSSIPSLNSSSTSLPSLLKINLTSSSNQINLTDASSSSNNSNSSNNNIFDNNFSEKIEYSV